MPIRLGGPSETMMLQTKDHIESAREAKHRACDACKRRKVRCSGRQPCQHCQRAQEPCFYSSPHGRLANAERRAHKAEARVRLFEKAWAKLLPETSVDSALEGLTNEDSPYEVSPRPSKISDPVSEALSIPRPESALSDKSDSISGEYEHQRADSFEWDESADMVALGDGIGSLSVQTAGIGYMGPQSGNTILRKLQTISGWSIMTDDEPLAYHNPTPQLSEDVMNSFSFCSQCLDAYFRYYHSAYPILHDGQFRAQFMGAIAKPKDGSWPILYNIVLALGAHSSEFCRQNADLYFYKQASRNLSWDILRRGSVSLVQALALMANYLQKRNRPNSGFSLLGLAMNMAQGIGLHREFSGPSISVQAMEMRRRVWWTLFIFDSGARVTFGRPTLTMGGISISLPHNLEDQDLHVDLERLPPSRNDATVSSSLIWQIKLAKIGNRANEELLHSTTPKSAVLARLNGEVLSWRESLPEYMQQRPVNPDLSKFDVPRMVLLWRSMHLQIVICRPVILNVIHQRNALIFTSAQSVQSQCLSAASECVTSIASFWNVTDSHHGALVWYACYWLVTAVFVHLTCLLYAPQHEFAAGWRQHIDLAKGALEGMAFYELTAARALQIIKQLLSLVPTTPDSNLFESNESVRLEFAEFWNQPWYNLALPQSESPGSVLT